MTQFINRSSAPLFFLSARCVAFVATVLFVSCFSWSQLLVAADATVTHSFLGVGKANRAVIVDEKGAIAWKFDMPASDGWVLPNGHVLLALYPTKGFPGGGVVEVDRTTKKVVFQYKSQQKEVSTVQPLPGGRYLVAELGPMPRAVVHNSNG
jgi:hypothetical protein